MVRCVKALFAGLAALILSGCATYDYYGYSEPYYGYSRPYYYDYGYSYDPYYYDYGPYYYGYGPGYYVGPPAVGFNFSYRDHGFRSDRRHVTNWNGDRSWSQRDQTARPAPTTQRNRAPVASNRAQAASRPTAQASRAQANRAAEARAAQRAAMRADTNRTDTAAR